MPQETLALACGLHRNVPGKIERGQQNPTLKTLLRIAQALGVSLSQLVKNI